MFFRLSPARRALLLFALLMMVALQGGSNEERLQGPQPHLFFGAACLPLLALEVADRVALKRDLETESARR